MLVLCGHFCNLNLWSDNENDWVTSSTHDWHETVQCAASCELHFNPSGSTGSWCHIYDWSISSTVVCREELKLEERPATVTCDQCKGHVTATELAVDCVFVLVAQSCGVNCTKNLFGGWESLWNHCMCEQFQIWTLWQL
jgi:hypothetical protein